MDRVRFSSFAMAVPLLFVSYLVHQIGGTSQNLEAAPPLKLLIQNDSCAMSNGIVSVNFSTPSGMVTKISYLGIDNLLEEQLDEGNRGYWTIHRIPNKTEDRLNGTSFKVMVDNEDQIEISFTRTFDLSSNDNGVPLNVDKRFVMLRESSGFYTYTVLKRMKDWPDIEIVGVRIVFKLQQNMSYYMAMSDVRQRKMPTLLDRTNGLILDYKEAVQLVNTSNPEFEKEVDDKYFYAGHNIDNKVYGWVNLSDSHPIGFWMISPSNEFRNGGPFKQDLTSHVGPTILNVFHSTHYAGKDLTMEFKDGKPWKKVFGPVFVYLNFNANAKSNPTILWEDAKTKMLEETTKWPYEFINSTDFVKSKQRGIVRGTIYVLDRYVNKEKEAASFAYVGLANAGAAGSWQRESKGYQFWTKADTNGNFIIKNVITGDYNLYASVPGRIGDYKYESNIIMDPGSDVNRDVNLKNLVFEPPRNGATIWEIGVPDRTPAEFFIPKPQSIFKVHTYQVQDRFKEYGLWRCYTDLYPNNDMVYTVGVSNYTTDWFFAHVTRLTKNNSYVSTTWQIVFDLPSLKSEGNYTLQLALAAAKAARLEVRFNDQGAARPHFKTGMIGDDNAVARHGVHGLYWLYSIEFASNLLVKGRNVIFLTQANGSNKFPSVMYDYIRLEQPPN